MTLSIYLRNFLLFLVVAIPLSITADLILTGIVVPVFPNPLTPRSTWLRATVLMLYSYGLTGGLVLSTIHTYLMSHVTATSRSAVVLRSVIYAAVLGIVEVVILFLMFFIGYGIEVTVILPGILMYGWIIGLNVARARSGGPIPSV